MVRREKSVRGKRPLGTARDRGPRFEGSQTQRRAFGALATSGKMGSRTQCRFCRRGEKYIDYKDVETLQKLLTNRGKIFSRKRSGNCASCQRKAQRAIKRARYMALLPFTS